MHILALGNTKRHSSGGLGDRLPMAIWMRLKFEDICQNQIHLVCRWGPMALRPEVSATENIGLRCDHLPLFGTPPSRTTLERPADDFRGSGWVGESRQELVYAQLYPQLQFLCRRILPDLNGTEDVSWPISSTLVDGFPRERGEALGAQVPEGIRRRAHDGRQLFWREGLRNIRPLISPPVGKLPRLGE